MRLIPALVIGLAAGTGALAGAGLAGAAATPVTDLRITVDPDGPGHAGALHARLRCPSSRQAAACRALARVPARAWNAVPGNQPCTMIYGGPQTARVTGRLNGRRIDARLNRTDGCEVERWQQAAPVLDLAR
jgi:hypothetical protein